MILKSSYIFLEEIKSKNVLKQHVKEEDIINKRQIDGDDECPYTFCDDFYSGFNEENTGFGVDLDFTRLALIYKGH